MFVNVILEQEDTEYFSKNAKYIMYILHKENTNVLCVRRKTNLTRISVC